MKLRRDPAMEVNASQVFLQMRAENQKKSINSRSIITVECNICKNKIGIKSPIQYKFVANSFMFKEMQAILMLKPKGGDIFYEICCKKCLGTEKYFKSLVTPTPKLYQQFKKIVQNQVSKKDEDQRVRLHHYGQFLQIQQHQIDLKWGLILQEISYVEAKLQSLARQQQALSSRLGSVEQLSHKIDLFVHQSEKYAELNDISNVSCIKEQSFILQSETINLLQSQVSAVLGQFSQYEIELSSRKEDTFLFHEDELQYGDRTYAIDNSILPSLKDSIGRLEKDILKTLEQLTCSMRDSGQKLQQMKQKPCAVYQQLQHFKIMLQCAGCQRDLFISEIHYKKVGKSHFQMGVNFFIFNSQTIGRNNKVKTKDNTFISFCVDCVNNNKYRKQFEKDFTFKKKELLMVKNINEKVQPQKKKIKQRVINYFKTLDEKIQFQTIKTRQSVHLCLRTLDEKIQPLKAKTKQSVLNYFKAIDEKIQYQTMKARQSVQLCFRTLDEKIIVRRENEKKLESDQQCKEENDSEQQNEEYDYLNQPKKGKNQHPSKQFKQDLKGKEKQQKCSQLQNTTFNSEFVNIIKILRLDHQLSKMWFLDKDEASSYRALALVKKEIMQLIMRGNITFGYPNIEDGLEQPSDEILYEILMSDCANSSDEKIWNKYCQIVQGGIDSQKIQIIKSIRFWIHLALKTLSSAKQTNII